VERPAAYVGAQARRRVCGAGIRGILHGRPRRRQDPQERRPVRSAPLAVLSVPFAICSDIVLATNINAFHFETISSTHDGLYSGVVSRAELDFETLQKFKQEVDLQRKLSLHPNIVRFLGACCPALQRNPQPADLQVLISYMPNR